MMHYIAPKKKKQKHFQFGKSRDLIIYKMLGVCIGLHSNPTILPSIIDLA